MRYPYLTNSLVLIHIFVILRHMTNGKLYAIVKGLAVVGVLLAVYLLWQQFFRPAFQPCYINSFINCNAIISGPVAKTLGIPTPIYGLIGYIVIFFASVFRRKTLLISMTTFGLFFCLYIAYRELIQLRVICPVCITCQIIMITVFSLSVIIFRRTDRTKSP